LSRAQGQSRGCWDRTRAKYFWYRVALNMLGITVKPYSGRRLDTSWENEPLQTLDGKL